MMDKKHALEMAKKLVDDKDTYFVEPDDIGNEWFDRCGDGYKQKVILAETVMFLKSVLQTIADSGAPGVASVARAALEK